MLIIIKFLAKIFSVLNSEVSPRQIAAGFAFGALIGLVPVKGLLPLTLIVMGLIVNINLPMMFVGVGIFKILSFGVDPLANNLGFQLLVHVEALKPFWTALYNAPVIPYLRFNNTIVLGSFVIGVVALPLNFFLAQFLVRFYRTTLKDKFNKLKIVQVIKASTFFKYYLSYKGITGG